MPRGVCCLCPGVAVLGGKVRALVCVYMCMHVAGCESVDVHMIHAGPALAPGETGKASISHLPPLSQVHRHLRSQCCD